MENATSTGFLTATEIADELVRRGVPFADAHEQVGKLVRHCTGVQSEAGNSKFGKPPGHAAGANDSTGFAQLSEEEARKYVPQWDSELRRIATSSEDATRRRNVIGGTAPNQVARQLRAAERRVVRFRRLSSGT